MTGEYANAMRDDEWQTLKGGNMSDDTLPPGKKVSDALKKATDASDPWADRMLESAKASAFTPWIIVGAVVLIIVLTVIITK